MPEPQDIGKRIQLLVEGRDQFNFFEALAVHLQLSDVQVQNFGGVSELRPFLRLLASAANFASISRLGIVRDAERNAADAFRSVKGSLQAAGLAAPGAPGQHADGEPAVSVLLLPGDNQPGMLETLLCDTFADNAEAGCIDAFFECAEALPHVLIDRPDKARAQAWLATKRDPHVSVGVAAHRGYWNLDHAALGPVRDFLTAL